MAGFPVLVEGLPVQLNSVKSKLAIYFQSKKKSGGGECEIRAHQEQGKFLVYFKNEEVQKNVVKKEFHPVQLLGPEPVQLRVTLWDSSGGSSVSTIRVAADSYKEPAIEQNQLLTSSQKHNENDQSPAKEFHNQGSPGAVEESDVEKIISQKQHKLGGKTLKVQLYEKDKEDEKYEPRTFLLRGFDVNSRLDHISLYVDSLSNNTQHHIEPLQDGETVAVTFETDIDVNSFLQNCRQKPFENHRITAQRLAKTNSVQIEGIHPNLSDDFLDLYFSNSKRSGGGEITDIIFKRVAMTAIVHFQDHEVLRRVTAREHSLKGLQLTVSRYYHDLQSCLYGNNGPRIKQPEQCDICVNPTVLNYIQKTRLYKQELEEIAKDVYCHITFADSPSSKQLILKPSFGADILLCYKVAKDWKKHAEEAVWKFINKFHFKDFPTDIDLWEKVKNKSRGLKAPGFDVLYCSTENKIVVVGEQDKVLGSSRKLQEILEKARRELEVERNTVEEQILLESLEELEFVQSHVKYTVPSVKISTSTTPPALKLTGLKEEVGQVHKVISEFHSQLERKPLNQSSHLIGFIKSLDLKKFVQTHFIQKGIKATLLHKQSVELLAVKADVKKGEDKIKQLFQEVRIDFTPQQINVAKADKWKQFLDDLNFDLKSKNVGCTIIEEKNQAAVIIVGYSDVVSDFEIKINSYLDNKQVIVQHIPASLMQVDYMESFLSLTELPEIRNKGIIVSYIRMASPGLEVSGAAEHLKEAVPAIEDKLSLIQSVTCTYNKPGEARALSKHKDVLQVKVKSHGCMLLIQPEEAAQDSSSLPKPVIKQQKQALKLPMPSPQVPTPTPTVPAIQISGVTVELKKGDITQESTDAIVNSTNNTLNLNSGVSGAILKAAGSSVEDECKALGQQPNDGVVVTKGGQLQCEYIVHMVGPTLAAGITTSVHKVLEECEKLDITTVAFPAIGTGKGGISCETAINAVFSGMENYFSTIALSKMKVISIIAFESYIYDNFADAFDVKKLSLDVGTVGTAQMTANLQHSYIPPAQKTGLLSTQLKIHNAIVEVKQGDITLENVNAIVNSTTTTLDLNSGVSGAIFAAAGSAVTDECKKLGSQPNDGVVVTGSGNLACDYIIHMVGQTSPAMITASVEKVLQECELNQIATVSFPALGTGMGGVKPQDAIESILAGFGNHLSQTKPSVITFIYVVVYDHKVYDVFSDVLQQKSQQMLKAKEINIGKVKVIALQGDITAEQTDAIVNCSNVKLNRNKGVSGAILKAAGQSVVDECSQLGVQSNDSVTSTAAGNLQVKYILHLAGWMKVKNTKGSVGKVLKKCEDLKISSVSFPAMGTGEGKLKPSDVANALLDAISDYVVDFVQPSLSVIRIVLFNSLLMDPFCQCMEQRFRISRPAAQTVPSVKPVHAVQPVHPITLRAAKHLIGVVEIYGMAKNDIAKAQQDVEDLIKENHGSKEICTDYAACFSDDERQQIIELCEKYQLQVEIEQKKITIQGHNADILESFVEVNCMLQAVKQREDRKLEETQMKKSVQWEFATNETAQPYDQSLNYDLEKAYLDEKKTLVYKKNGEKCTIDFNKMQEKDSKGNVVGVKRRLLEAAMFELPTNWTIMNNQEVLVVSLQSGTTEYKDVAKTFKNSCKKTIVDIVKIERIQNRKLWQSYSVRKETAQRKNPRLNIEQILYHGTTKEISQKVNKTGFNRSFCGRNATYFGKGTYFALNALYSCDNKYSNPDSDGCKYIYQARVITGKECKGEQDMLEPAPVNPQIDSADLCDCAVDDLSKPSIFVIFCDDGAYPEYLITFKTRLA
ncbi:protein mono-ADP-ribosyltransferase PARP14-like isoform X2 [Carcharodon carcharias]|uniref:protein mono-ADP-ribosyltransferase PARP14-like isoform X2 n=1 Tax=Carcharodon carcharias TaxID=13397 RepID=UPI001B7DB88F|nr:protein mono-ADP-ribosyltransferase PARP14-like isoform X2 [Carcharodon carcharias]